MASKVLPPKPNWKPTLYTIAGLLGTVVTGALANKLAGVEWKGLWPFLKHLPGQIWTCITWPISVPLILLGGLLLLLWRFVRQTFRLGAELSAKAAKEREVVQLSFTTTDGFQWRFHAVRGSPSPKISDLQQHCQTCGTPIIIFEPPGGPNSWMGDGSARVVRCPQGHIEIDTSYRQLEQVNMTARALAVVTAEEYFREQGA